MEPGALAQLKPPPASVTSRSVTSEGCAMHTLLPDSHAGHRVGTDVRGTRTLPARSRRLHGSDDRPQDTAEDLRGTCDLGYPKCRLLDDPRGIILGNESNLSESTEWLKSRSRLPSTGRKGR